MIELHCGDCLELMKDIPDKSIDLIFTSPPYNRKRNDKYDNYDDSIENYYIFLKRFTELSLKKISKYLFLNIQATFYNKKDVYKFIGEYSDKIQQIFIWEKSNPTPSSGGSITNSYEFIFVLGEHQLKTKDSYIKNHITTSVCNTKIYCGHHAIMNQNVSDWFIEKFSDDSDTILDPFMGTGTTGISCKKLNRNFIGIEIEPKYFEIAKQRIELGDEFVVKKEDVKDDRTTLW